MKGVVPDGTAGDDGAMLKSTARFMVRSARGGLRRGACAALAFGILRAAAATPDYAESRHAEDWLRHPVYGDPSFDAFQRSPGNPVHRGRPPYEWPVNGFLFADPRSGHWYVFVGDYGKGYMTPPSRCLVYRSTDAGRTWSGLGVVLQGDPNAFDKGGHTPDASVVYDRGRYHMVYDWGEPDFTAEGGIAYAWADRPEGPWHRAPQPITRNSTLSRLEGRYQRTYAATLLRRANDWLILGMMDRAPHSWVLFGMTASRPEGPYSERRLLRQVESDRFHPPLMEFFPAFAHDGFAYAPATSVALNRNFNALFRAPLDRADDPGAWALFRHGSLWHAEDVEAEHFGIWGQTFSGFVGGDRLFHVMFPSRDSEGRGTINLAQRPWGQPLKARGFVLTGHAGPSLTLLRQGYEDFTLDARFRLRGRASVLLDFNAPLGPNAATSDSSLHPLSNTRHLALRFAPRSWSLVRLDAEGGAKEIATGALADQPERRLRLQWANDRAALNLDGREVWSGPLPGTTPGGGAIGLRVEPDSHLAVDRFRIRGEPHPTSWTYLHTEALLGAGASPAEWTERADTGFRFGTGAVSVVEQARAKWNFIGTGFRLWSPRGPGYGIVEIRVNGEKMARIDLASPESRQSEPVFSREDLPRSFHAVVLVPVSGRVPLDCLETTP